MSRRTIVIIALIVAIQILGNGASLLLAILYFYGH